MVVAVAVEAEAAGAVEVEVEATAEDAVAAGAEGAVEDVDAGVQGAGYSVSGFATSARLALIF